MKTTTKSTTFATTARSAALLALALLAGCNDKKAAPGATPPGAKKPPKLSTTTLDFTGCELKIRHWFAATRKRDGYQGEVVRKDVVLEVVASYVAKREPAPADADGDKAAPPRDSIHRQQHLTLWGPNDKEDDADWFSEELASWTAETWRTAEPRVLDSFLLHDLGPFPQLAIIKLLPCYDPTSDEACATELRKRKVYRYASPF